ncbi:MAG: hypothetical protein Kow0090_00720 [Myxococcota bacterium]
MLRYSAVILVSLAMLVSACQFSSKENSDLSERKDDDVRENSDDYKDDNNEDNNGNGVEEDDGIGGITDEERDIPESISDDDDFVETNYPCTVSAINEGISPKECLDAVHCRQYYRWGQTLAFCSLRDNIEEYIVDYFCPESEISSPIKECEQCAEELLTCYKEAGCGDVIDIDKLAQNSNLDIEYGCAICKCNDEFIACFGYELPWEEVTISGKDYPDPRYSIPEGKYNYCNEFWDENSTDDDDEYIPPETEHPCSVSSKEYNISPTECMNRCQYSLDARIYDCMAGNYDSCLPAILSSPTNECLECVGILARCYDTEGCGGLFDDRRTVEPTCAVCKCNQEFIDCFGFEPPWPEVERNGKVYPDPRKPIPEGQYNWCDEFWPDSETADDSGVSDDGEVNGDDDDDDDDGNSDVGDADEDAGGDPDDASEGDDGGEILPRECEDDIDCAILGGEPRCERSIGRCVECIHDIECDPEYICQNNACVKEQWQTECYPPCDSGKICEDGFCKLDTKGGDGSSCQSDADCKSGFVCINSFDIKLCREICSATKPCSNANYQCTGLPSHCE